MMAQDLSVYYDALRNADKAGDKASAQKIADYISSQGQGQAAKPAPKYSGSVEDRVRKVFGAPSEGSNPDYEKALSADSPFPDILPSVGGAKLAGNIAREGLPNPVRAAGDWLDRALGKFAPTAQQKAAQVLQKTASNPAAAKTAIDTAAKAQSLVKGARQTTAAQAGDEGLLGLEKTVRNFPGASERLGREVAAPSNVARSNVVGSLAGDAEKLGKLKDARSAATEGLYRSADKTYVNVDPEFKKLAERPSMQKAIAKATQLAKEAGDELQPGDLPKPRLNAPGSTSRAVGQVGAQAASRPSSQLQVSGKGLHYLKLALDQQIEKEGQNALTRTQRRLVTKTRNEFLNWAEERIPEYKQAREAFAKASRPINRMELMQKIQAKATSNATDAQGNKIITRNGYQNAVKQYRKELERTMSPVQLKHIDRISKDLDMAERVNSPYIKPAGSETLRHANAASVLGRLTGGHGISAATTQLLAKVPGLRWMADAPPEKVRELLVEAMLDPEAAKLLLEKPTTNTLTRLADKFDEFQRLALPGTGRGATVKAIQGAQETPQSEQQ